MNFGTMLQYSDDVAGAVDDAVALEKVGLGGEWVAEARSFDAGSVVVWAAVPTGIV